jgi:hypothetical protein
MTTIFQANYPDITNLPNSKPKSTIQTNVGHVFDFKIIVGFRYLKNIKIKRTLVLGVFKKSKLKHGFFFQFCGFETFCELFQNFSNFFF